MAPKGQKKPFDNGLLCGLGPDIPRVPPKITRPSLTAENVQIFDQPVAPVTPSPRPQSLTLPFQNRDRASHLISDEEFDKIMRQGELENTVPRLPSAIPSHLSGFGVRRAASTARASRNSFFAQRQRPASANFSSSIHATAQYAQDGLSRSAFSRDPTLTALPRPPTKNDMAVYPSQSKIDSLIASPGHVNALHDNTAITTPSRPQTPALRSHSRLQDEQKDHRGHKRKFSLTLAAANMVESVKKRMKRADSSPPSSMRISSPIPVSTPQTNRHSYVRGTSPYMFPSSPIVHPNEDPNSTTEVYTDSDGVSDADIDADTNAARGPKPARRLTTAKKALEDTWSLTRGTAKGTLSKLPRRPKEPTFVEVFPTTSSRRTTPSTIQITDTNADIPTLPLTGTTTTTTSTAYFASAETSPNHIPTTIYAYPSAPAQSHTAPRPKPWQVAPRSVLGSEIERLENRTMELVARNEGYTREIEYLRGRIGRLEAAGIGGGTATVRRRSVAGMEMEIDEDVDMDDKRKTWMTCHSDDGEDEDVE